MNQILPWLIANQAWLIPLAIYLALNLAKRDYLVANTNPVVRGVALMIEKILVLEWNKWGGSFKFMANRDE